MLEMSALSKKFKMCLLDEMVVLDDLIYVFEIYSEQFIRNLYRVLDKLALSTYQTHWKT